MNGLCLLEMEGIKKYFGGVRALNDVDFAVREGEVHGIVGENGAGKSTLMKILGRELDLNAGTVRLEGESLNELSPWEVQGRGIITVHQDLNLIRSVNIGQNVLLGRPSTGRLGFLHWKKGYPEARRALEMVSNSLDIEDRADTLSAAQSQLVILARALVHEPKILILDEPTARLGLEESDRLFALMDRLKRKKVTIIYISHRLEDIFRVCDRVTVLRDGGNVSTSAISKIDREELVSRMLGRKVDQLIPKREIHHGEKALEIEGVHFQSHVRDISFHLRSGEILGLVGAVGAGKSELLNVLFGVERPEKGSVLVHGRRRLFSRPRDAIRSNVVLVPEDRKSEGLVMDFFVRENLTLAQLKSMGKGGWISKRGESGIAARLIEKLRIITPHAEIKVQALSGGNQQKVVLGKWLLDEHRIFLLDEVTAGIDVGAKFEIYELLGKLTQRGAAVLLATSDIQEAMGICDRLLVMHRGRIVAQLAPGSTSREEVLTHMMGGELT